MLRPLLRTMSITTKQLIENYTHIALEVQGAATARGGAPVRLVAVSKFHPAEAIAALHAQGVSHFGENYLQELVTKANTLPATINWHFIGSLQTNKCKELAKIPNLYAVETIDTPKKALKLNEHREGLPPVNVYVQVNTSGEAAKSGVAPELVVEVCRAVAGCTNLRLRGLMTIGLIEQSVSTENLDFAVLAQAKREVEAAIGGELELSMGMSGDFAEAIRQGSTSVRIGSKIFGPRPPAV